MRRIQVLSNGQTATIEAARETPGVHAWNITQTPDGQIHYPIAEYDADTLTVEEWEKIKKHDKKLFDKVKSKLRITYMKGSKPEIDQVFKDFAARQGTVKLGN